MRWLFARLVFWPTVAWNVLLSRLGLIRKWDRIDDHVILGGLPFGGDVAKLSAEGVTAVVNTCEESAGPIDKYADAGIVQLRLPIVDFAAPTMNDVARAIDFIRDHGRDGHSVYLHCKAGRGRSATIAICWLMASQGLSPDEAHARIRANRPQILKGIARRRVVQDYREQC